MNGKQYFIIFIILLILLLTLGIVTFFVKRFGGHNPEMKYEDLPGAHVKKQLKGYSDSIQSSDIISFSYECGEFVFSCEKEKGGIHIISKGGDRYARDGSAFHLDYVVKNSDIMDRIQKWIKKYELVKKNGYWEHVNGLPAGLGDTLSVTYSSDEKIYMTSNQSLTVSQDANLELYYLFQKIAVKNGYQFNTELSNVKLYDDADYQYLQGIWKGKHFGDDIWVSFLGNTVEIRINGIVKDSCEYTIVDGFVRKNELRNGVTKAKSRHDYEDFNGVSSFAKKNDFTIVGYFLSGAYSTCDLLRED